MTYIGKPSTTHGIDKEIEQREHGEIMKGDYENGMGLRGLMDKYGVSYGYARVALKAAGVTLRERGSNRRPGHVITKP